MPAGVDEGRWEKAKQLAADEGRAEDWPYVMGIYQRMSGKKKAKNVKKSLQLMVSKELADTLVAAL